jgi:hypothetical protein
MTKQDITQFESALGITLPGAYRTFLLLPLFTPDATAYGDLCLGDVGLLIEENRQFRANAEWPANLQPRERYLVIGSEEGNPLYVLDLHDALLPVVEASFGRTKEVVRCHASLAEFLSHLQRAEQEAAADDARAEAASPWPRRLFLAAFVLGGVFYVVCKASKAL